MKKGIFIVMLLVAAVAAKAEVELAYEAGAEVVSAYIWRGQYNGGLSFQPDLEIGYDGENTALRFGVWGNIGASDWGFRKGLEENENGDPNTRFMPELDLMLNFSFFGASVGFNHYYYCDGSNFFSWQNNDKIIEDGNTSTTEVWAGVNIGEIVGDFDLHVNWYTTIAGNDFVWDEDDNAKRAWSSYLEIGGGYTWEDFGLTLSGEIGMSPWASDLYGNEKFAVTNLSVKLNKAFDFDICELDIFAQGSLNPDGINKENAYIKASGDDKLYNQKLNGVIGVGIWF